MKRSIKNEDVKIATASNNSRYGNSNNGTLKPGIHASRKRGQAYDARKLVPDLHIGPGLIVTGSLIFNRYAQIDGPFSGHLIQWVDNISPSPSTIRIGKFGEVVYLELLKPIIMCGISFTLGSL